MVTDPETENGPGAEATIGSGAMTGSGATTTTGVGRAGRKVVKLLDCARTEEKRREVTAILEKAAIVL